MTTFLSVIEILYLFFLPPVAYYILRRRTDAAIKPLIIGYLTYMFVSMFRAVLRLLALNGVSGTAAVFISALRSGVLEEAGRYFAMKHIMHEHDMWRDGISYGIGHGGCELFLGILPLMLGDLIDGAENSGIFAMICLSGCIAFHIAMSLIVMASVHYRDSKKYLYIAMALHTLVDLIGGLLMRESAELYLIIDLLMDAAVVYFAYRLTKKLDEDYETM